MLQQQFDFIDVSYQTPNVYMCHHCSWTLCFGSQIFASIDSIIDVFWRGIPMTFCWILILRKAGHVQLAFAVCLISVWWRGVMPLHFMWCFLLQLSHVRWFFATVFLQLHGSLTGPRFISMSPDVKSNSHTFTFLSNWQHAVLPS